MARNCANKALGRSVVNQTHLRNGEAMEPPQKTDPVETLRPFESVEPLRVAYNSFSLVC